MPPDKQFKEQKYFERLNITCTSISKAKQLIKDNVKNTLKCWEAGKKVEKQTFHMIGPAGVGKTQICYQIADELGSELQEAFGIIMVKAPVLSRDDFIIPFPVVSNGTASFKMLYSDFVPKNQDTCGLFIIDECGRGDHQLQQLMWQVENECKIHLMNFPKKWFVIATDNPDDREYSMDILEDAAGLRRMLHLYIEVSAKDFLAYAIPNEFHRLVTEFIEVHPEYIYDFESQKLGAVYANPASWEKTSNILWGFEMNGGPKVHLNDLDILLPGLLNVSKARLFTEFIRTRKVIKPQDIFNNYDKAGIRDEIIQLVNSGDNATLSQLMNSFLTYLAENKPNKTKKSIDNVATFLTDIPVDTASILVSYVYKFQPKTEEYKYFTNLHVELMKSNEVYQQKFYSNLVDLSKKASEDRT